MWRRAHTWLERLIGRSYAPRHKPMFVCVKAKEAEECQKRPPPPNGFHMLCGRFPFPTDDPTVEVETKIAVMYTASSRRSAESICSGAEAMQLPDDSVKGGNSSCKSRKKVHNTQKNADFDRSSILSFLASFLFSFLPFTHHIWLKRNAQRTERGKRQHSETGLPSTHLSILAMEACRVTRRLGASSVKMSHFQ